jgi:hypothetical protein
MRFFAVECVLPHMRYNFGMVTCLPLSARGVDGSPGWMERAGHGDPSGRGSSYGCSENSRGQNRAAPEQQEGRASRAG